MKIRMVELLQREQVAQVAVTLSRPFYRLGGIVVGTVRVVPAAAVAAAAAVEADAAGPVSHLVDLSSL